MLGAPRAHPAAPRAAAAVLGLGHAAAPAGAAQPAVPCRSAAASPGGSAHAAAGSSGAASSHPADPDPAAARRDGALSSEHSAAEGAAAVAQDRLAGVSGPIPDPGGLPSPAHSVTASAPGPSGALAGAVGAAVQRSFDSTSAAAAAAQRSAALSSSAAAQEQIMPPRLPDAHAPVCDTGLGSGRTNGFAAPLRAASPKAPPAALLLPSPKATQAAGQGDGAESGFGAGPPSLGAARSAAPLGDISNLGLGSGSGLPSPGISLSVRAPPGGPPATPVFAQARTHEGAPALGPLLTPPPPPRVFADEREAAAHLQVHAQP